jgi:hypothetical protein
VLDHDIVRGAYKINNEIAVYLKYASEKTQAYDEYVFTFQEDHRRQLAMIADSNQKTFLVLVCVQDREICCISYERFKGLIDLRRKAKGALEDQYSVLVTSPRNKQLRVYVNVPGKKRQKLGEFQVKRSAFPDVIFE